MQTEWLLTFLKGLSVTAPQKRNSLYSEIVATLLPNEMKRNKFSQNAAHKPNPVSFTAQTGLHFNPPRHRDSPKVLISSSQKESHERSGDTEQRSISNIAESPEISIQPTPKPKTKEPDEYELQILIAIPTPFALSPQVMHRR